jgi:hypothetical protein
LRSGKDVSERSAAWKAKQTRDQLISDHALLKTGFARLQARASGLEREVAAEYAELVRVREPIIQAELDKLACELALKEEGAAVLRSRLRAFSLSSAGPAPQKLSGFARGLLVSPPKNSVPPQINSPGHFTMNREKEIFRNWRTGDGCECDFEFMTFAFEYMGAKRELADLAKKTAHARGLSTPLATASWV